MSMGACHHCKAPLSGEYVHVEIIGRDGPRSPADFCNAHCLAEWARYISDEADKRIAQMRN